MKPKVFYVNFKKFYFSELFKIIEENKDDDLFEFKIINNLEIEKIYLVSVDINNKNSGWNWFVSRDLKNNKITYHYKDLVFPETDFDNFIMYVKNITPKYLHLIFFNYIV